MDTRLSENWANELRSEILPLAVLGQLDSPKSSALLIQVLEQRGLSWNPGELLSLLRRLENQKLLTGTWDKNGTSPRKYYVLSEGGVQAVGKLKSDWRSIVQQMELLLDGGVKNETD